MSGSVDGGFHHRENRRGAAELVVLVASDACVVWLTLWLVGAGRAITGM